MVDISKFFNGSTPGAHITSTTPEGKKLLEMTGWSQAVPNHKDGTADLNNDRRPTDPEFYTVGATFVSPDDEHYYGLGQNHEGFLDHRGHTVDCWHDYTATAAPSVCVPFVVTNKGYGLIWDNPSKTTIEPGFNERPSGLREVGRPRFIFCHRRRERPTKFMPATACSPAPRRCCPRPPTDTSSASSATRTQEEVLAVAKGYRDRHLPADVHGRRLVLLHEDGPDGFRSRATGPTRGHEQAAARHGIPDHDQRVAALLPESRFYDLLLKKGWFEHLADGTPTNGLPYDRAGSDIDTTNPDAARLVLGDASATTSSARDSTRSGPTKPSPTCLRMAATLHVGPGTQYFNVYPLFHTGALYDGFRRDVPDSAR